MNHLSTMRKHLEDKDHVAALRHLGCMEEHAKGLKRMKHLEMSDVKSEDYKNSMEEMQKQIDELNTQIARVAGMVDEIMTVEKEEGEDMIKEGEEPEQLEGKDNEDEKTLEGDESEDEEKKKLESEEEEKKKLESGEEGKKKLEKEIESEMKKKGLKKKSY